MSSSYEPFLIGKFTSGLFNYLQPWASPEDSFRDLQDAYIFRGCLNKRQGTILFGSMAYRDTAQIGTGNGGVSYTGTLVKHPIRPGTFNITVTTSGGLETFSSNSSVPTGTLTGSLGDSGTIVWSTGVWTMTLTGGRTIANAVPIYGSYTYTPNSISVPVVNPIMFIETFFDEETDLRKLLICDTRRAAVYNSGTSQFDPLNSISEVIWIGDNTTTSITLDSGFINLNPFSLSITDGTSTIVDDGAGNLSASGNFAAGGTVVYSTGLVTLKFTVGTTATITMSATISGDYFTGNDTNFFNGTNWLGDLYLVNNVDRITAFDGTNLSRPSFPITQAHLITFTNDITTCLDLEVYKNRFLVLRPLLVGSSFSDGQSIRWSAINRPTNLVADVAGNGGELSAPTDDWIQSEEFLRDQLIISFEESTWSFRFTGNQFDPFRFDRINSSKSCNSPYGTIPYDDKVTAMGVKGLTKCDGVNVDRYDLNIVDSFLQDINKEWFEQCFGVRFDSDLNQSFMLYPSEQQDQNIPEQSDKILIYNFLEDSWAVYNLPMSCLGLYRVTTDATWNDFASPNGRYVNEVPNWNSADFAWDDYALDELSPTLMGGGHDGNVYQMNFGSTDNGTPFYASITSTRWNPYMKQGLRTQFGYIDFYYQATDQTTPTQLELQFFTNNSETPALTKTLTLDSQINADSAAKRIYLNLNGEFIQMQINSLDNGTFQINGIVLWARQGGRFTPGFSV